MASFKKNDIEVVSDALEIAEDATGNFYKFSLGQWKKHHYDVKTRSSVGTPVVDSSALAVLFKGSCGRRKRFTREQKTGIFISYACRIIPS
jgi:hypothetical protein